MKRQTVEEYAKERTGEKPEEKVERLMLEAKEIADKNSIPYVLLTKRKSLVGGGTARELFAFFVCAEVRIGREIGLSLEDLVEEVTRTTKLAYQVFEEFEEERICSMEYSVARDCGMKMFTVSFDEIAPDLKYNNIHKIKVVDGKAVEI